MAMLLFQVVDRLKFSVTYATLGRYDRKTRFIIYKGIKDNWRPFNAMVVHRDGKLVTTLEGKYQIEGRYVELV